MNDPLQMVSEKALKAEAKMLVGKMKQWNEAKGGNGKNIPIPTVAEVF